MAHGCEDSVARSGDYRNTLEDNRTDLIRGVGLEHCFLSEFWTKNQQPKVGSPSVSSR